MKSLFVSLFVLISTQQASAQPFESKTTLLYETNRITEIALNPSTVLCSRADYAGDFLKVLIPQLSEITLLDHRNFGAGAPCVGAGMCEPGNSPGDILDPSRPTERIRVNIKVSRIDLINHEKRECSTTLEERIKTKIRGIEFFHLRTAPLGSRDYRDCATN